MKNIISFIDNNSRGNKDFSAIEYNNKIHIMYTELLEDVENEAIVCD